MRGAALNLAALSFTIAGASACAPPPEPARSTAQISTADPSDRSATRDVAAPSYFTTDPAYFAASKDVAGQPYFTTDPAYFAAPRYAAYQTYFMSPTYVAIGGFHRHRHVCGHRASHARHR